MSDLLFKISAVIHILIVITTYVPKKKRKTLAYYIFNALIIIATTSLLLDLGSVYFGVYHPEHTETVIISKATLCSLMLWMVTFVMYIRVVTSSNLADLNVKDKEQMKSFKHIFIKSIISVIIALIGITLIPLYLRTEGESLFMSGPCMIFYNICYASCIITWVSKIIMNRKNLTLVKVAPLIPSTIFAFASMMVQIVRPEHPVMSFAMSLIVMVTYHGIHNPDLAVIEELNEATKQANAANRAKSDFLSSMSHEIRTPLNAIVGFSQALGKKELPSQAQEEVKDILNASNSLLETINGILDISKLEANKIELVKTNYSTKHFIEEIKTISNNRLGNKTIELKFDIDENLPPVLYGDSNRLKQIIMNLLTNSIKYTNEGSVTAKVEALSNKEKCLLTISIIDTGVGMTEESLSQIFTKFQRFDIDKYTNIEGTGLGMAITKGLVTLMGGEIFVTSEYGKGTKFVVSIEQEVSSKTLNEIMDEAALHSVNPFDASGQRVLVVDDNRVNLKVAERFLDQYKLDLDFCISGRDCLDKINSGEKYDLILLDIMMPRMKGTEVIKELKMIPGFETPVVALTADVISDIGEKYTEAGFDAVITKPIVEEDLYNVLKKYIKENDGTVVLDPNREIMHASDVGKPKIKEETPGFSDLPDVNYLSEAMSLSSESIFPELPKLTQEPTQDKQQEMDKE